MQILECFNIEDFLIPLRIKNNTMPAKMWTDQELTVDFFLKTYSIYQSFLVYEEENIIGGFLLLENDFSYWSEEENKKPCYYIHKLFLLNEYTKQGYTEKIIEAIINKGKRESKEALRLDCRSYLDHLNNLYERLGFHIQRQMVSPISGKMNLRQLDL